MKRRRLVALVSSLIVVAMGLVVLATGFFVTQTNYGQEQIRRLIREQLAGSINGKLYIGHISGSWLTGISIDSLALRGPDDSLFVSTGRVTATYDPRDLIDKRVYLRSVDVEHPLVILHQHEEGEWNYQHIFKRGGPPGPKTPGRKFGDYVVLDSVRVHDGFFRLTLPWHPDDSLHGARRDSAIRYELARKDHEIRREHEEGKDVFQHTYRWQRLDVALSHIRLADPDSDRFGRFFAIDSLRVAESDPPFDFRDIRGSLRQAGDSIWIDVPHFDLPASTGKASGKLWWGSDLPLRYDIAVHGDSVALNDVAWVYPTLPTTGGGSLDLYIRNDARNLHVMTYRLANMDVRTTKSHLLGTMTFAVGGPVLAVRDVDMRVDPMDWDFLRVINGKPFPEDFRGQLVGTVKARGGPLNQFIVDAAQVTWRDGHVPGAVSSAKAQGGLDILFPAFTKFHGLRVDVAKLDLRTIEYLFPNFPALRGTVAGVATLDSSWLDVRFSQADLTHQDGEGQPSRFTGAGRVTWGEQFMTYDMDLVAQPLSLTMLARSYPKLPLQGIYTGPVKVKGTVADLAVATTLQGEAGTLSFDGTVDSYPPGYAVHGTGQLGQLDLARLVSTPGTVPTSLTGEYALQLAGDSLADLAGTASVGLRRSEIDGTRIYDGRAALRFAGGRLSVDTLRAETVAGSVTAQGALGLPHGVSDSMTVRLTMDSLGGLRRWLAPAKEGAAADTLEGLTRVAVTLAGRLDSLDARGEAAVARLIYGAAHADSIAARFDLHDVLRDPRGSLAFAVDTLRFGTTRFDSLSGVVQLAGKNDATFRVAMNAAHDRVLGGARGVYARRGGVMRLTIDSLAVAADTSRWQLAAPATFARDSQALTLDSLVLRDGRRGRIALAGAFPDSAPVHGELHAERVALGDLGMLLQSQTALGGEGSLDVRVDGTRAAPVIGVASQLDSLVVGSMHVERVTAGGSYRNDRFSASMALMRKGVPALQATASLPVALTLFGGRLLDDSLSGQVRADTADFAIVEAFSPDLQNSKGRLSANLAIGGTWKRPTIGGTVAAANGEVDVKSLGIRLHDITADIAVLPGLDSLKISRLSAWSGARPTNSISLLGSVGFADRDNLTIDLTLQAHQFHAMDRRTMAKLDVSTGPGGVRLFGPERAATLTGTMIVDRGTLYLPDADLLKKQVVDLTGADTLFGEEDERSKVILPQPPSALVQGLNIAGVQIRLGDDVWMRSNEADVKLSGALSVRSVRAATTIKDAYATVGPTYKLALEGSLNADRGTYNLDLGVVQREFRVQSGTITFQGTADNNPIVDITALHTVRRPDKSDIGVLVHLHGPLNPYPALDFASTESYEISQTDLVSYLVAGQPSFETTQDVKNTVASVLLPTASTYLSGKLKGLVGSGLEIQGGTTSFQGGSTTSTGKSISNIIWTSRLGGEKQLTNNLFVRVTTGLCAFRNEQQGLQLDPNTIAQYMEWKLDYRLNTATSLQAGIEPATSQADCTNSASRLISTPRQFGLSLFHTWNF